MPGPRSDPPEECFHCGLPVPANADFGIEVDGHSRPMCCPGCAAVASALVNGGLTEFYRHRTEKPLRAIETVVPSSGETTIYDHPEYQQSFVTDVEPELKEARLILTGITCAACIWLNEQHLLSQPGVIEVEINYASHRARVRWDPGVTALSRILSAISEIGYMGYPYDRKHQQQLAERDRRKYLKRIGVAAALGMQVMMIAVALYFGDWSGIDARYRDFLRWISLLLTAPILAYSGQSILLGAWRDLSHGRLGMDVPVSLGLTVAFVGSVWATISDAGHVYYDSVAMFILFLLATRYFELSARRRGSYALEHLTQLMPATAVRITAVGARETILTSALQVGDLIEVLPGASVPADGHVGSGTTTVSESLLTGESHPITKTEGDKVIAGSINTDQAILVEVDRVGADTMLSAVRRLVEQGGLSKPRMARLADRVAGYFVLAVLLIAAATAAYWWFYSTERWLPVLISVLVVTCPCALSLATPTALAVLTGTITKFGVIPAAGDYFDNLSQVDHIVFDKTGTLTEGSLKIEHIHCPDPDSRSRLVSIAAALEKSATHPIANAVMSAAQIVGITATEVRHYPGQGVRGTVQEHCYYFGTPFFIHDQTGLKVESAMAQTSQHTTSILADADAILATFEFSDIVRADASATIQALHQSGMGISLWSGDQQQTVAGVAASLQINDFAGGLLPQQKLDRIRQLQTNGRVVAMVGDGINDAPVLAAASVSIAMGASADLAQSTADMVLVNNRLGQIPRVLQHARKTRRIIRQNFLWAIGYNLAAVPLAMSGHVPPWLAALGMSLSSLLVVANASRVRSTGVSVDPAAVLNPQPA